MSSAFSKLLIAAGLAISAMGEFGRAVPGHLISSPRAALGRGRRAGRGPKAPNPAGTKLARKARERKLGLRWC